MNFTVLQFHASRDAINHLNSVGWGGDFGDYPELAIQRDVKFEGSEGFSAWMSEYFEPVAIVSGASDLEDVFHVGNGYTREGVQISRIAERMHSVSVGDIVHCQETDTYYMVDGEGWTQLLSFLEK